MLFFIVAKSDFELFIYSHIENLVALFGQAVPGGPNMRLLGFVFSR